MKFLFLLLACILLQVHCSLHSRITGKYSNPKTKYVLRKEHIPNTFRMRDVIKMKDFPKKFQVQVQLTGTSAAGAMEGLTIYSGYLNMIKKSFLGSILPRFKNNTDIVYEYHIPKNVYNSQNKNIKTNKLYFATLFNEVLTFLDRLRNKLNPKKEQKVQLKVIFPEKVALQVLAMFNSDTTVATIAEAVGDLARSQNFKNDLHIFTNLWANVSVKKSVQRVTPWKLEDCKNIHYYSFFKKYEKTECLLFLS